MSLFFLMKAGGQTYTLTLNNTSVVALTGTKVATAKYRISSDGNVYIDEDDGAGWVQINTTTDWVRPATAASDGFEARFTNRVGNGQPGGVTGFIEDTWYSLSSDFTLSISDAVSGGVEKEATFDVEIRKGSTGNALISAQIYMNADYA
jgi:hypothetical protein